MCQPKKNLPKSTCCLLTCFVFALESKGFKRQKFKRQTQPYVSSHVDDPLDNSGLPGGQKVFLKQETLRPLAVRQPNRWMLHLISATQDGSWHALRECVGATQYGDSP